MRLDLDVRRVWRCPECGIERRSSGDRTVMACHVCKSSQLMSLVDPQRASRSIAPPLDLVIGLHPDDVDVPPLEPLETAPETVESTTEPVALSDAQESVTTETAPPPDTARQKPDSGKRSDRKKGRRRSRQKSGKQSQTSPAPAQSESSDPETSSPVSSPSSSKASPSDSFGSGLEDTK